MRPENASPRSQAFFKCVGRTFLHGFALECAVMCRSVLEAELVAEVSPDDCISVLGSRNIQFELTDRIATAGRLGRLTSEGAEKAHRVRRLGNDAVHGNPSKIKRDDLLGLIADTLQVLCELDR